MTFKLILNKRVYNDIESLRDNHSTSRVKVIILAFEEAIESIIQNPFFAIRYDNVRCLPLGRKIPYMIHYTVNESSKTIHIEALISTKKNPDTSWIK